MKLFGGLPGSRSIIVTVPLHFNFKVSGKPHQVTTDHILKPFRSISGSLNRQFKPVRRRDYFSTIFPKVDPAAFCFCIPFPTVFAF